MFRRVFVLLFSLILLSSCATQRGSNKFREGLAIETMMNFNDKDLYNIGWYSFGCDCGKLSEQERSRKIGELYMLGMERSNKSVTLNNAEIATAMKDTDSAHLENLHTDKQKSQAFCEVYTKLPTRRAANIFRLGILLSKHSQ